MVHSTSENIMEDNMNHNSIMRQGLQSEES
jgi:hypothetical protein